jgi:hypothetical protein
MRNEFITPKRLVICPTTETSIETDYMRNKISPNSIINMRNQLFASIYNTVVRGSGAAGTRHHRRPGDVVSSTAARNVDDSPSMTLAGDSGGSQNMTSVRNDKRTHGSTRYGALSPE